MEEIVRASKIACEFRELGCGSIISGAQFQDHVRVCEFRPQKCAFGEYNGCNHSVVSLSGYHYLRHLTEVHKIKRADKDYYDGNFVINYTSLHPPKAHPWNGNYTVYNGKVFVVRCLLRDEVYHFSLSVIGSEADAAEYNVRMIFKRNTDTKSDSILDITIPVLAIGKSIRQIMESVHCVLPRAVLVGACGVSQNKLVWQVKYKILPKTLLSGCCVM
jgi:hypothetical protein